MRYVKSYFPLIFALFLQILLLWVITQNILILNNGHFVYGLDDTYIHMSLADNIVNHGVWGVTPYEFSSSSSSLLYTFILSFFSLIFPGNLFAPLLVNLIVLFSAIFFIFFVLHKKQVKPLVTTVILTCVVVAFRMTQISVIGMEHLLHGFLLILFIWQSVTVLAKDDQPFWNRDTALLYGLTLLLATVRYEGLFSIAVVVGLLLLRGRWKIGFAVGIIAALPIALYSLFSISNGAFFLPNSVLLKGGVSGSNGLMSIISHFNPEYMSFKLLNSPVFLTLFATMLIIYFLCLYFQIQLNAWYEESAIVIWLGTAVIFNALINSDIPIRYRDFLIISSLAPIVLLLRAIVTTYKPREIVFSKHLVKGFILLGLSIIAIRVFTYSVSTLITYPVTSSTQIYMQQYQMANFVNRYYNSATIAANDIGAITFFTDIHLLDLFGLGSNEVARVRYETGTLNADQIEKLVIDANVDIIMIYDSWFEYMFFDNAIPESWVKVGTWTLPTRDAVGDAPVSFYTPTTEGAVQLLHNMREYEPLLPEKVSVSYEPEIVLLTSDQ